LARILLDTTILIDFLRGRPGVHARVGDLRTAGDEPYTCAVNVEEVVRGLRPAEHSVAGRLFEGLRVVPLIDGEGWQAGEWRRFYAQRGVTLSQGDCLIAAAALAIGGRLATGNPRDFPMPELSVEHWPAGQ
jgi:predicted nucleic acid-binding protein